MERSLPKFLLGVHFNESSPKQHEFECIAPTYEKAVVVASNHFDKVFEAKYGEAYWPNRLVVVELERVKKCQDCYGSGRVSTENAGETEIIWIECFYCKGTGDASEALL